MDLPGVMVGAALKTQTRAFPDSSSVTAWTVSPQNSYLAALTPSTQVAPSFGNKVIAAAIGQDVIVLV